MHYITQAGLALAAELLDDPHSYVWMRSAMIALLQRVSEAGVSVDSQEVARIGNGLLVLVGVQKHDTHEQAIKLAQRLIHYRVFEDADGKMNRSVLDSSGEVLLVPQFTLAANTRKGRRPSFDSCAPPALGRQYFEAFCDAVASAGVPTVRGIFGADMAVSLINDGPVTFWLEIGPD
ncbi:MAG: D-aminoacyl-tRNA deacylase [Pseudomonadota bacterium]